MTTWERPGPTRRELRVDALVAVLLAAATLLTLELGRVQGATLGGDPPSVPEQTAWALAVCLPLALRRRLPLTTLLAVSAVFIGLQARYVPEGIVCSVALYLALFSAGAWGRDRRRAWVVRVGVVAAMFAWLTYGLLALPYGDLLPDEAEPGEALSPRSAGLLFSYAFNAVYFGAAVAFGELAWRSARQRHELVERTAQLEAERAEVARRTRETEQLRIARDLHDVVAHHVSLMGVQAGAARRAFATQPERAMEALGHVEATSRTAVEEMRRMLAVLRREDADGTGTAAVEALPALVAATGTGELSVDLTVVGEQRPVPASVSSSAYRVVQEALTNTVKHADARRADVRVRYLPGELEVEVVDDGRSPARPARSGSHGQVGMRERVALHDGELELGPRPTGGYRVRARFPA